VGRLGPGFVSTVKLASRSYGDVASGTTANRLIEQALGLVKSGEEIFDPASQFRIRRALPIQERGSVGAGAAFSRSPEHDFDASRVERHCVDLQSIRSAEPRLAAATSQLPKAPSRSAAFTPVPIIQTVAARTPAPAAHRSRGRGPRARRTRR
jgi:hypothetical protein